MRPRPLLAAGALIGAIMLPAFAADAKIDGLKFGEVISGPQLKPDDLRGHVVLVEMWGLH